MYSEYDMCKIKIYLVTTPLFCETKTKSILVKLRQEESNSVPEAKPGMGGRVSLVADEDLEVKAFICSVNINKRN